MRMTGSHVESRNGSGRIRCELPRLPLLQGAYAIDLWLGDGPADVDMLSEYLRFTIDDADVYGSGQVPFANLGVMYLEPRWTFDC
jgi:hypothetical protein